MISLNSTDRYFARKKAAMETLFAEPVMPSKTIKVKQVCHITKIIKVVKT